MCDFDTKLNLHNLYCKKKKLKNRYKIEPTQNILFNILNIIKQINTLKKKI
jgi:hypothetical protein